MAKRFAVTFFIVLGVCVFLVAGFALVLCLAPGFYALGLKYIAAGTHVHHSRTNVVEHIGSFNGSVVVETNEIPIYVIFSEGYEYEVEYYDDFCGYTTSTFDNPTISITKDALGNAVVQINEFRKFLYESSSSKRYLNIFVPLASISTGSGAYSSDFTVSSDYSSVTFKKETDDARTPTFDVVKIETSGKINVEDAVKATTFDFKTPNSITIPEDRTKTIDATNYYLESSRGKIEIYGAVAGDAILTTQNSNIKLLSCSNLVAKSGFGTIISSKAGESISVSGLVNIKTTSGSVYLGEVGGTGENVIETGSGNVQIDKIGDGKITTSRGSIFVKSLNNVTISTNVGKVTVHEALEAVDVTTKRGNVYLGGETMPMNNPTVFSRLGKVFVYSASGTANIQTISGNISFTNDSADDITINCGAKLTATGLTGKVTISANKDSSLNFKNITDETRLTFADTVSHVEIRALNNSTNDLRYYITGKNVVRYEDNGTGTFSKIDSTTKLENLAGNGPLFRVDSVNAVVDVYLASSN